MHELRFRAVGEEGWGGWVCGGDGGGWVFVVGGDGESGVKYLRIRKYYDPKRKQFCIY